MLIFNDSGECGRLFQSEPKLPILKMMNTASPKYVVWQQSPQVPQSPTQRYDPEQKSKHLTIF